MNSKLYNQIKIASLFGFLFFMITDVYADTLMISGTGFYSRTRYSDSDFNKSTRVAASISYLFWWSELEFSYQQNKDHTYIRGYQNIILRDKIYSANYVQNLLPRSSPIQPFVKGGVGQLRREYAGSYEFSALPPRNLKQPTAVLGAGLKIYLSSNFGIKTEVTSYLQEGRIRTWKDNVGIMVGVTLGF